MARVAQLKRPGGADGADVKVPGSDLDTYIRDTADTEKVDCASIEKV